jgi:hypothetical protein
MATEVRIAVTQYGKHPNNGGVSTGLDNSGCVLRVAYV